MQVDRENTLLFTLDHSAVMARWARAQSESAQRIRKGNEHENLDGANVPRPTRQYRPQNRFLAGRICRSLLRFQRRRCSVDARLPQRRAATDRSKERSAGKSDASHGAVQE